MTQKGNKQSSIEPKEKLPSSQLQIHQPKRRLNLGNPWLVIVFTLFIFFASQLIATLIISIGLAVLRPDASISRLLDQSAPVQFSYVLVAEGLVFGLTLFVVKKIRRLSLGFIGLGRWPHWRDLKSAVAGAVAFYGLLIAASILITLFLPEIDTGEQQDVGFNVLNSALDGLLAFVALVFLPPIGEETLMRGYLYSGLRARWRFVTAMLVTSLLFGVAHLPTGTFDDTLWIAAIDTFLLSLVLVYLRERTGALYAPIMVHAANNFIAFTIHFK